MTEQQVFNKILQIDSTEWDKTKICMALLCQGKRKAPAQARASGWV